ncbi:MAG: DUF6062 family protein [Ignavibacteriaceae bacterium]
MGLVEDDDITRIKRSLSWVQLSDAFKEEGCPICGLMEKSIKKYFDFLLYEYVLDASVHKKLIEAYGLCNTHTWQLKEAELKQYSDGFGVATILETTLHKEIRALDSIDEIKYIPNERFAFKRRKGIREYIRKITEKLTPQKECIGCMQQKHTESYYTHEMIRISEDKEFQKLYEDGKILLCRPHFVFLINEITEKHKIDYFIQQQKIKLSKLSKDIGEFIRKHYYRFKNEMTEEDRKSWIKLLEHLGGKKKS